jgi:hypothetical protein
LTAQRPAFTKATLAVVLDVRSKLAFDEFRVANILAAP